MNNKKLLYSLLFIPMIILLFPINVLANTFTDVEIGNKHYVAITYLSENGIIDGYDDNTFKPYNEINRAEALKMLTIATEVFLEEDFADSEDSTEVSQPFTDTPQLAWYTKYLIAAKEKEIIHGYEDGTFKPDKTINLAETLKIFFECYPDLTYPVIEDYLFEDTPIDSWFIRYTALAGSYGLLEVNLSNKIFPNQEMTRGYVAEIIYRMIMRRKNYEFGKATFYGAAVQGNNTASGEIFDMNKFTAAHKTLPFGSIVEVTNLANNKSVQVKINDRGPYGPGRVIDLSSSAFSEIAWLGSGVIDVQVKVIQTP